MLAARWKSLEERELEERARALLLEMVAVKEKMPRELAEAVQRDVDELGALLLRLTRYYELFRNVDYSDEERVAVSLIAYLLASTYLSIAAELTSHGLPVEAAAALALQTVATPPITESIIVSLKAFELYQSEAAKRRRRNVDRR